MPGRIPRVTKTEAIVLRHRRLGDADRIVTLLTPTRGKIDVVAKGALRSKSRMAGHLEPLTRTEVVLAHGRSMDVVTQAQTADAFTALHADLDRLSTGMYLLEATDRLTFEEADLHTVYDLLHAALVRLARGDGLQLVARTFELALLEATGFRPEWSECLQCGAPVAAEDAAWSAASGGVYCANCRASHGAVPIDSRALRVLRAFQSLSYEEAARIRLEPELSGRIERIMNELMQAVTEREMKSAQFVATARRVAEPAAAVEEPDDEEAAARSL